MPERLKCVLLIDDCEADNFLHQRVIERLDIAEEVCVITDSYQALKWLISNVENQSLQPELIFLDINNPEMRGWDFMEEYRKLGSGVHDKSVVVMLSGSLNPEDRTRAESIALIAEYQPKPLTGEMLSGIMERHFAA